MSFFLGYSFWQFELGKFILLPLMFLQHVPITMEKAMAPHSSTLTWKIPWAEEPGGLQSVGLQRVRHN